LMRLMMLISITVGNVSRRCGFSTGY
jgi:hypothetical protein